MEEKKAFWKKEVKNFINKEAVKFARRRTIEEKEFPTLRLF